MSKILECYFDQYNPSMNLILNSTNINLELLKSDIQYIDFNYEDMFNISGNEDFSSMMHSFTNNIKKFFSWLWNKIKELGRKIKDFVVRLFSSKEKERKTIEHNIKLIEQEITAGNTKVEPVIKEAANKLLNIEIPYYNNAILNTVFIHMANILEKAISQIKGSSTYELETFFNTLIKQELSTMNENQEIITLIQNLFVNNTDIVPENKTLAYILNINTNNSLNIIEIYRSVYDSIKNKIEENDKLDTIIERKIKEIRDKLEYIVSQDSRNNVYEGDTSMFGHVFSTVTHRLTKCISNFM
jgi:hypothetical protein